MSWEEWFPRVPGTRCKIYLARILGRDPVFRFARSFRNLSYAYSKCEIYCSAELEENGVFELCARWYDDKSEELVSRERSWFVVFEGFCYELDEDDVLLSVFNLNLQTAEMSAVS